MDHIQRVVEEKILAIPNVALGQLLRKKLKLQGVQISDDQAQEFAKQALDGNGSLEISHPESGSIDINISQQESNELIEKIQRFLDEDLESVFIEIQSDIAPQMLRRLKKDWPAQRRWQTNEISSFRSRLGKRWKVGLGKLQMLIAIARDLGGEMNLDARARARELGPSLVEVITRMHARSCQIAEEIIVLMESGFANGAMARWRTMHEVFVVAAFISKHGEKCAKAYCDHQVIESKRGCDEYLRLYERLGYPPIPKRDAEQIKSAYEAAVQSYGAPFKEAYGWAAAFLNSKRPNLAEIETAVGTEQYRSHYRMASHGVHANPKGIFASLTSLGPTESLLSGPSNAGLADPGHACALTLTMISAELMRLSPTFDHQLGIRVMHLLSNEIGRDLLSAHNKLKLDEKRISGR